MKSSEDAMLGLLGESTRNCLKTVNSVVVKFVQERYPPWQDCSPGDLRAWLTWHWCQGLLASMVDAQTGKLCSVVVVRYVDEPWQYESAYCHKPGGTICCVELAIADNSMAFRAALECIRAKHGDPEYIIHERARHGLGVKMYPWKRYKRLLEAQDGSEQI